MTGKMTVTGVEEVRQLFAAAPKNIVMLGYARALEAAIEVIATGLASRTPVLTGSLALKLVTDVQVDENAKGGTAAVGFGRKGYIAYFVEYGHAIVGHKPLKTKTGKRVPEHPFMRPAYDATADEAVDAFAEALLGTLRSIY